MDAVLICNVGHHDLKLTRDLELDGQQVTSERLREDSRRTGELLLANWDSAAPALSIPIIDKFLARIRDTQQVRRVHLFVTNQQDSKYSKSDTVTTGKIIERLLADRRLLVKLHEFRENPADWDLVLRFYLRRLPGLALSGARHYLGLTGGTQQMNTALLIAGMEAFAERHVLSATSDQPLPALSQVDRLIQRRWVIRTIISHLDHGDYWAAYGLLKDNPEAAGDADRHALCLALLDYGHLRLCFRFDAAARVLAPVVALAPDGATKATVMELEHEAIRLYSAETSDMQGLRLQEIARSARLYHRRGQWLELPALTHAFREMALSLLVERAGVQVQNPGSGWPRLDLSSVRQQAGLTEALNATQYDGQPLKWQDKLTVPVARAVLAWAAQAQENTLKTWLDELDGLEETVRVRNRTVFGHASEGVNEETLSGKFPGGGDALVQTLGRLAGELTQSNEQPPDPFDRVHDLVSRLLLA